MARTNKTAGAQHHLPMFRFPILVALSACAAVACGSAAPITPRPSPLPTPSTGGVYNVVTYGASGDGQSDSTVAFGDAIQAAEAAGGGVVYAPAGKYLFNASKTGTGGSIVIDGTAPITLQGAGRDETFLIEGKANKGLLGVHIDHTVVEDLTLNTQEFGGGAALFVQANDTSFLNAAILGVGLPFIEVHLSNIQAREEFRRHSYFSDIALGVITGLGALGYELAVRAAVERLSRVA
jgi:hypothetical protein